MTAQTSADTDPTKQAEVQSVERDAAGRLVVRVRGREEPFVDAAVARCFPWSLPEAYLALRDKEGKEIALLKTPASLDEASRRVVEEELRDKVFNPRILRAISHTTDFGVTAIRAATDRGEVIFEVRNRDDIRALSPTRALFRDADGNTYEVADLNALDPASRRIFAQYL